MNILYILQRPITKLYFYLTFKPEILGKENLPKKGRCILAGNHTNNLDCLALNYGTLRKVRYVAKKELTQGIKGIFFKAMGIIPVDRSKKDGTVIPKCVKCLKKEELIGIFPEGTINKTKDIIMPFKKGVIVMSLKSNSPIVPFAINGEYKKNKLKIIYGKPYYPKTEDVEKEIEVLEDKVISLMKKVGVNK